MVQDIVVHVGLDTKITPRESLVPLILTLEGEKAYKEYTSLDALLADYNNIKYNKEALCTILIK